MAFFQIVSKLYALKTDFYTKKMNSFRRTLDSLEEYFDRLTELRTIFYQLIGVDGISTMDKFSIKFYW
jgi:hypothetical protein